MSVLKTPEAEALLAEADVTARDVADCAGRLDAFLEQYLPLFYRKEQRVSAGVVMRGLLSDMERKTAEPCARREKRPRKPIQFFVGQGKWDDEAVMTRLRGHVVQEIGDPAGVIVFDTSGFPKKGTESVGVQRQWCGRLGKIENCQVGVFMAYASAAGHAPLDRRLFLPEEWADDPERRKKCGVPADVTYQTKWKIAVSMLKRHTAAIPHGWIASDDEFGRVEAFRKALRGMRERYVLDVPCNTLVRDLRARRPRRKSKKGRMRKARFVRVDAWAARVPPSAWRRFKVTDGEKGPIYVDAVEAEVVTKDDGRVGPQERLVVIRTVGENPDTSYSLSNAKDDLASLVRVHAERHAVEEFFEEAKGEAGLAHYEVRGWTGWKHHVTLAFLASWFLATERRRIGKKKSGGDGPAGQAHPLRTAS